MEVKGAKRWLDLYFLTLQPIEILKPLFILITVKILTLKRLGNSQVKYFFSFAILISVLGFNALGDALRDAIDPYATTTKK